MRKGNISEIHRLEAGEICHAFISSSCHLKAIIPFGPEYTSLTPTHAGMHTDNNSWCNSVCSRSAYTAFIVQLLSGQRAMSPCPNMSCRCCRRPYPRSIRGDQHRIPLSNYALRTAYINRCWQPQGFQSSSSASRKRRRAWFIVPSATGNGRGWVYYPLVG